MAGDGKYYFCLSHGTVEQDENRCKADNRLGPYGSEEEARNWKERVDERNEAWDEADEEWEEGEAAGA